MHVEGRLSVQAVLESHRRTVEAVLIAQDADADRVSDVAALAKKRGVPIRRVAREELDSITHAKTHGGVVALCTPREPDSEEALLRILDHEKSPFLLLLEGVDDARNFGATLRTAEALGVHAVIVLRREWDLDETDVMRSSSGAFERLCVVRTDRDEGLVDRLKQRGLTLLACVPNVMGTIYDADLTKPLVVCLGGEKRGLSGTLRGKCTQFVRIPMKPGSTSLTMVQAAAVVMGEAVRQRKLFRGV